MTTRKEQIIEVLRKWHNNPDQDYLDNIADEILALPLDVPSDTDAVFEFENDYKKFESSVEDKFSSNEIMDNKQLELNVWMKAFRWAMAEIIRRNK